MEEEIESLQSIFCEDFKRLPQVSAARSRDRCPVARALLRAVLCAAGGCVAPSSLRRHEHAPLNADTVCAAESVFGDRQAWNMPAIQLRIEPVTGGRADENSVCLLFEVTFLKGYPKAAYVQSYKVVPACVSLPSQCGCSADAGASR
jgi:hypothetical protein